VSTAIALAGWVAALAALAAALAARRALLERMELVARAAHELRGALTAAGLGLERLRRPGCASRPAVLAAVSGAVAGAGRSLDDLAQARSGGCGSQRREPVEVGEVLRRAAEQWRPAAAARGVDLVVRPAPAVIVQADPERLVQACGNLVANAIEHGAGPIVLSGRAGDGCVALEVADRGPGLPAPVAALAARPRGGRGARGRGLAIASQIARRHGGRLAAAPAERGARLALELPARAGAA